MHGWLREFVFQGVFGVERPSRLSVEPGLCTLILPQPLDPHGVHELILATLFPDEFPEQRLASWAGAQAQGLRLGVSLHLEPDHHFKLYRRVARDSVVLRQLAGGGRDQELARGARQAAQAMRKHHSLPDLRDFLMLQAWDFSDFLRGAVMPGHPEASAAPQAAQGEHAALIAGWRQAREAEELDQEIDALRFDLKEAQRRFDEVDQLLRRDERLKEQIAQEEARLALPPEDAALVDAFETRKASVEHRQEQLQSQIEEARQERLHHLPGPWFRDKKLMAGLVASLLCLLLSALVARPIALANLLFLGVSAWAMMRRLQQMEAATVYELRVEQIYLHLEQAGRDASELERQRVRILAHVKESDLGALRDKIIELEDMRKEAARRALPDDKERQRTQKRHGEAAHTLEDVKGRLEALEARREPLGKIEIASYELESMLYERGVDVADLEAGGEAAPQQPTAPVRRATGPARDPLDLFFAVTEAAARAGLLRQSRLSPKTQELWRRFALHVLGQRFASFEMDAAGHLRVEGMDSQATQRWLAQQPEELPMLAAMLSAALMATGTSGGGARLLCINLAAFPEAYHARLDKIFHYLGKYLQVVILEPPEG